MLVREWISKEHFDYIIYGLGFGYHVCEHLELDENITIRVFESEFNIIYLACVYSDIYKLLCYNRVELIYDYIFKILVKLLEKYKMIPIM